MTLPNKITLARIFMIPVFVWLTLDYIRDYQKEQEQEWERVLACAVFAIAAISDAVDGYIARRYHQKSELGVFLDPLADKALLLSALILLSIRFKDGTPFDLLPLWFPVLVVSRDLMLLGGCVLIHMLAGRVIARPRIVGKCATFFQMIAFGTHSSYTDGFSWRLWWRYNGLGREIERPCREPSAAGRVTPCAPRLQPACSNFPRRRVPTPLPIRSFPMFPRPNFGAWL